MTLDVCLSMFHSVSVIASPFGSASASFSPAACVSACCLLGSVFPFLSVSLLLHVCLGPSVFVSLKQSVCICLLLFVFVCL